jgi:hypothetical protein
VLDLPGLDQGERLEQLVQRAVSTRVDDEGGSVLHEHRLPHEEELEIETPAQVWIGSLLERQLDVAANRETAGLEGATVGGLHDPGTAAGDHRDSGLG